MTYDIFMLKEVSMKENNVMAEFNTVVGEGLPDPRHIWERKLSGGWGIGKYAEPRFRKFSEDYREEIGPNILDIGSGEGRHLVPLSLDGYTPTGFDITESGLKITKVKIDWERTQANLVRGNFHHLPFKDGVYDTVISTQAMQHNTWRGVVIAFSEASRVLKPGGLFFLRIKSDKCPAQDDEITVADKGRTYYRKKEGYAGCHHCLSFGELEELAEKNTLHIEPGYIDEKRAGDNFVILGQWNITFRKKAANS